MRRVGPCVLLLALAGCVPEPAFDNDPLLGGRPLPRNSALAAAPKPAATSTPTVANPPTSGLASPASLAAGTPSNDANSLRIGPPPGALASAPHDASDPWHGTAPSVGATLKQPEPITDASVRPSAAIAPPTVGTPAPASPGGQYEYLQDMLAQRGVLFQSLDGPDEHGVWRFRCGVAEPGDPTLTKNIEASAPGDRGLGAIRAAIDKIDHKGS